MGCESEGLKAGFGSGCISMLADGTHIKLWFMIFLTHQHKTAVTVGFYHPDSRHQSKVNKMVHVICFD